MAGLSTEVISSSEGHWIDVHRMPPHFRNERVEGIAGSFQSA